MGKSAVVPDARPLLNFLHGRYLAEADVILGSFKLLPKASRGRVPYSSSCPVGAVVFVKMSIETGAEVVAAHGRGSKRISMRFRVPRVLFPSPLPRASLPQKCTFAAYSTEIAGIQAPMGARATLTLSSARHEVRW